MATCWILCLMMVSATALVSLEPRSFLNVTLSECSEVHLRDMVKSGGQRKINIHFLNSSLIEQLNSSIHGEQNFTYLQFMFGWDKWAWVTGSEEVVLDLEFRDKVLSLGIFSLAEQNIAVKVDFYPKDDACEKEFTDCFKNYLSLTEKIQEIAVAVKRKIDIIVDHEDSKCCKIAPEETGKNETCNATGRVTNDNCSNAIKNFGENINRKSSLCFPVLRPSDSTDSCDSSDSSDSSYLQTDESREFNESHYSYTYICISGKDHLKELKISQQFLCKALSYRRLVSYLLMPFLPLFFVWIWPKSSEITPSQAKQEFEEMVYIHLDNVTPTIILGFIPKLFTMKIKMHSGKIHDFVSWFRRFFLIAIISTHALIVMGILDRYFYHDQIEIMMKVTEDQKITIDDLESWDYLFYMNLYSICNYWRVMFCILISAFWIIGVAISSRPANTQRILSFIYPSPYFGFKKLDEDMLPKIPNYFEGIDRVSHGMTSRLGFLFNRKFWVFFCRSAKEILEEKSVSAFFKIMFHFFSLFSFFPLFIFFPWDFFAKRKDDSKPQIVNGQCPHTNEATLILKIAGLSLLVFCSYIFYGYVFIITVYIYIQFLIYIIAATIKNYQLTLTLFGVIAGSLVFVLRIRSNVQKTYIGLKMTIVEVATAMHKEKIEAITCRKDQDEWKSIEGADGHTHVPELILRSQDALPCIPKCLYDMILRDRNPVGIQRLKVLIKLVAMGLFVFYITMVNQVFRVSKVNETLQMSQAVLTVGACILPSLLAGLQTDKTELRSMQDRIRIRWLICNFLKDHTEFYNYSPEKHNSNLVGCGPDVSPVSHVLL